MAPLAKPIFVKMISLARLISTSKMQWRFLDNTCKIFALSGPKFEKFWVSLQELPKFDISLTEIAKKHTLAQTKIN